MKNNKPLSKKEEERLIELSDKARKAFLENSVFYPEDWLDSEKEVKEYENLFNRKFLKKPLTFVKNII